MWLPGGVRFENGGTGSIPLHHGWHRHALRAMLTGAGTVGIPTPPAPQFPLWHILHLLPPFLQQHPEQAAPKPPRGEVVPGGHPSCLPHPSGSRGHRGGSALPLAMGFPSLQHCCRCSPGMLSPGASASQSLRGLWADRGRGGDACCSHTSPARLAAAAARDAPRAAPASAAAPSAQAALTKRADRVSPA